jgi:hypothetical protein
VYLPLYAAGIVGPAIGAVVVTGGGVPGPFILAGIVLILGAAAILARPARPTGWAS